MPYKLKIEQDTDLDGLGPRDWDNLGHMVCWHRHYKLGDEQRNDDASDWLRELACSLDPSLEERLLYWEDGNGWMRLQNEAEKQVAAITAELRKKLSDASARFAAARDAVQDITDIPEFADQMFEWKQAYWVKENTKSELDQWVRDEWHEIWKRESAAFSAKEQAAIMAVIDKHVVILPLYLYDHSGITMSTSAFSCPWDSGQVGYIYATRDTILKEFSAKKLTKELRAKVADILRDEVNTYDQYLTGDVYGYVIYKIDVDDIDEDGVCDCDPESWNNYPPCDCCDNAEVVDSCWGFYGSYVALEEGRSSLRFYENKDKE